MQPHPATVSARPLAHPAVLDPEPAPPAAAQRRTIERPPPHAATVQRSVAPHPATALRVLPPHPATVAQRAARPAATAAPPHAAHVGAAAASLVQPMLRDEVNYLGEQTFAQLLRCPEYEKQPAIILTLTFDANGQDNLFNTSHAFYTKLNNCTILNDSKISFDTGKQTIGKIPNKVQNALKDKDVIVVLTAHGNVQWLFGETPGQEGGPAKNFAAELRKIQKECEVRARRIVLDACWSATELASPPEKFNNSSSARTLSKHLGDTYTVYGFNGTAGSTNVSFCDAKGIATKASYAENVCIFVNGVAVKGSTSNGNKITVYHSTELMGNPFYRKNAFAGELPEVYASKSFPD
ncbi:hypothetical protein WMF28_15575 [Sorangium sp. So ce590]|uniref:hypothetical protein n=1 Tax=Sorangium sp. So ce590 TaxID=3133317 RepID=UPI003F60D085